MIRRDSAPTRFEVVPGTPPDMVMALMGAVRNLDCKVGFGPPEAA